MVTDAPCAPTVTAPFASVTVNSSPFAAVTTLSPSARSEENIELGTT